MEVVNYYYYNSNHKSLLHGKDVTNIEGYASGEFDMKPYKRMFKSLKKAIQVASAKDGSVNEDAVKLADTTGIDWSCVALIPTKLNSAVSIIQKIPVEVECSAIDALAMKKREEDIEFLKNKPVYEEDLKEIAEMLGVYGVDLGSTRHSSTKFSDPPMGIDINNPEERDVFEKLFYALNVETAFEKSLQIMYEVKKAMNIRLLETKDQFKFGVSVHRALVSPVTGMADIKYEYPGNVSLPDSDLPDFSDVEYRIINCPMTVLEMFNYFGDEIQTKERLEEILNGKKTGYSEKNRVSAIKENSWGSQKLNVKYIEVRTVDWVNVVSKKNSRLGARYLSDSKEGASKIYAQNTYGFYWLQNTDHVFGVHRLPWAYRTRGQESFQNFSSNIYKSQEKSAVELSIGENKKAQIADIKLQHLIIKSLPPGKYIDLRYLRNALSGLKDEENQYTIQQLVNLAMEQNVIIGDTEGFDGKNDGQLKPFMEILGGLKMAEAQGYLVVIATASTNISNFTGINEQLAGQSANPEGLVGMQKLLINSSLNALYYANEAIRVQYQSLFNVWGSMIQQSVESGGKAKEAIISMIGVDDVNILDGLDQIPMHNLTIKVNLTQREEERMAFNQQLQFLKEQGIITTVGEYLLSAIENPKEKFAALYIMEKKYKEELDRKRAEEAQNRMAEISQSGKNMVDAQNARVEGEIKKVYAKGDVESKLEQLVSSLDLSKAQQDAINKKMLQEDRGRMQVNKAIQTIKAKKEVEQQEPLV